METRANYIMVGAFVVGLMVSFVFFVLWISRIDFGEKASHYDIYFEGSVTGLRVNEDVRYHGIPVGKVKEIGVDPHNIDLVRVRVSITEPKLMREDIIASIEAQGLTGYSYIQIQGGKDESPLLKAKPGNPYPIIPSQPSKIDLLFSNAPHLLSSLYKLSEQLNDVLNSQNRKDFQVFLSSLSKMTQQLSEGKNSLDHLFHHAQKTLDHINRSLGAIETGISSFTQTMSGLEGILQDNRVNVSGAFSELPKTLKQVTQTADHLRRLTQELEKENPLKALSSPQDQGYPLP